MPFIGGGALDKVLKQAKKFSEREIKFYATQLIYGLKYLHDSDIMHRDLKLENLLLDENGYLKIVDFGVAKVCRVKNKFYDVAGTPLYLPPEMILGEGYDKGADWWAVGCILYYMLVGAHPFHGAFIKNAITQPILNRPVQIPN